MTAIEVKVKLKYPITSGAALLQEVALRRPKVKDALAAQKIGGSPAEKEVRLVANLASLTPAEVEELDCSDYASIQEALQGFATPKHEPSASPKL